MAIANEVERVRRMSDDELLAGLRGALGSTRRWTALVIVHLAEVEERRLQLLAGNGSMFEYCTMRLGMSEDEAYRRIEVARLARRFPILVEPLADGRLSLSVAVLLKARLTEANHLALTTAVSGKTVSQAREVLATWFPQPDVPASIRKLPERRPSTSVATVHLPESAQCSLPAAADLDRSSASAPHALDTVRALPAAPSSGQASSGQASSGQASSAPPTSEQPAAERSAPRPSTPAVAHPARSSIEPLAFERYRVQLTAGAELKRKLELARDLLRHAVPGGDLADIIDRALDLLIEKTLRRRFGKTTPKDSTSANPPANAHAAPAETSDREPSSTNPVPTAQSPGEPQTSGSPSSRALAPSFVSPPSRHLPRHVRRAVIERDASSAPGAASMASAAKPSLARARSHHPARHGWHERPRQHSHPLPRTQPAGRRASLWPGRHRAQHRAATRSAISCGHAQP